MEAMRSFLVSFLLLFIFFFLFFLFVERCASSGDDGY